MMLPRIPWPLRINPAGRDKEKEASRGGERACNRVAQGRPQETSLGLGLLSRFPVPLLLEGLEALLAVAPHCFLDPAGGIGIILVICLAVSYWAHEPNWPWER
jgi:hypothetical protein